MVGGDAVGGSAALARLIDQAGEAILADFQRYYGIDLRDVLRPEGTLSPRRALALIRWLPPESATYAVLRGGPEFYGWGPDRYMSAALIDAVKENTYAFVSANSKRKPKPPEPVERPDMKVRRKRGANSFRAMAAARIAAAKNRKAN